MVNSMTATKNDSLGEHALKDKKAEYEAIKKELKRLGLRK